MSERQKTWLEWACLAGAGCAPGMTILRERGRDVRIVRVPVSERETVIVKLWNRPGLRGSLRRLTRTGSGHREYAALRRLEPQNIGTPRPLAFLRLRDREVPYTEALVSTDLGVCGDSTEFFKRLLASGDAAAVDAFEARIIETTAGLVRARLVDPDHRLPNFVIAPDGRPVRLDFELCRCLVWPRLHPRLVGLMLGTLLGSYVFAVQPDFERAFSFAARLREAVRPNDRVRRIAAERAAGMIERQRRETGIDSAAAAVWSDTGVRR
jgi:hypothetical protein